VVRCSSTGWLRSGPFLQLILYCSSKHCDHAQLIIPTTTLKLLNSLINPSHVFCCQWRRVYIRMPCFASRRYASLLPLLRRGEKHPTPATKFLPTVDLWCFRLNSNRSHKLRYKCLRARLNLSGQALFMPLSVSRYACFAPYCGLPMESNKMGLPSARRSAPLEASCFRRSNCVSSGHISRDSGLPRQ